LISGLNPFLFDDDISLATERINWMMLVEPTLSFAARS
jgi:hypothetical protein